MFRSIVEVMAVVSTVLGYGIIASAFLLSVFMPEPSIDMIIHAYTVGGITAVCGLAAAVVLLFIGRK